MPTAAILISSALTMADLVSSVDLIHSSVLQNWLGAAPLMMDLYAVDKDNFFTIFVSSKINFKDTVEVLSINPSRPCSSLDSMLSSEQRMNDGSLVLSFFLYKKCRQGPGRFVDTKSGVILDVLSMPAKIFYSNRSVFRSRVGIILCNGNLS